LLTCKQIYFVHQSMERPGNLPHWKNYLKFVV
jgi:hypothetical protein